MSGQLQSQCSSLPNAKAHVLEESLSLLMSLGQVSLSLLHSPAGWKVAFAVHDSGAAPGQKVSSF